MKKLSIIIPVINLWEQYTRHCLDSISKALAETDWQQEDVLVMVIDNGSTDATKSACEKMAVENPYFQYVRNEENKGVAGSWNQGVYLSAEKGFERFLILNSDVLLHQKSIKNLVEVFDRPDVYLASMLDISGEVIVPEDIFALNDKEPSVSPGPNFSAFMIGKKTLDKMAEAGDQLKGAFDEGFKPGYFEDNDYHYRLKLYISPMAAIATTEAMFYHYGSRTQNQQPGQPIVPGPAFEKNRAYFQQKWGGWPGAETFKTPFNK